MNLSFRQLRFHLDRRNLNDASTGIEVDGVPHRSHEHPKKLVGASLPAMATALPPRYWVPNIAVQ
jgi:hypothetical protein